MSTATRARACILWSVGWLVFALWHVFTEPDQLLALVHGVCALIHVSLLALSLRMLAYARRLQAAVAAHRRSDRARLRARAWFGVWSDREAAYGPRDVSTMAAHLGTVKAVACYQVAVANLEFLP